MSILQIIQDVNYLTILRHVDWSFLNSSYSEEEGKQKRRKSRRERILEKELYYLENHWKWNEDEWKRTWMFDHSEVDPYNALNGPIEISGGYID